MSGDVIPPDPWDVLIALLDGFRTSVRRATAARVSGAALRASGKELVQHYFRVARPTLEPLQLGGLQELDEMMHDLLQLTNGRAQRSTYISLLGRVRQALSSLEGQREVRIGQSQSTGHSAVAVTTITTAPTDVELRIIRALERLVPSAALSYQQALADLASPNRVSFRGPANELREALREVLDQLAPDEDVVQGPGYTAEVGQTRPTQTQKVRYILRLQGVSRTAREAPEYAVRLVEEAFAMFARSAYQRSNISTHVAETRREVMQMKMYVDSVLSELLEIHAG